MESREAVEPTKKPSRTFRFRPLYVAILVPVMAVAGLGAWRYLSTLPQRVEYAAKAPTFSDSSEKLAQTAVVPTLDTPCPPGRNIIWCTSFQLAWNEIRNTVITAPLDVPEATELAARLNASKQSVADLDAKSVYAAGGWVEKGIREKIKKDMAAKFPSHALPDFSNYTTGVLAYSYLTARLPFKRPFQQRDAGFAFVDSRGLETRVAGFGLWESYGKPYEKIRDQVEILYVRSIDEEHPWELKEYALDLCRYTHPYQVVVARVELKGSLAETLEHIRNQIADFRKLPRYGESRWLHGSDELELPEIFWRIDHRFTELIGKAIVNVGMPIVEALQTIEFRLDRSGVFLESQSELAAAAAADRHFEFNRPFLVYMQKRGAEHPFFVMWVDNAELLVRK